MGQKGGHKMTYLGWSDHGSRPKIHGLRSGFWGSGSMGRGPKMTLFGVIFGVPFWRGTERFDAVSGSKTDKKGLKG